IREQQLIFPTPNRVEQSLETTWGLVCDAVHEVLADAESSNVISVVITNQRGSVVPLDERGEPLSNLIVWMDSRGLKQVDRLNELIGDEDYYNISGHPIVPITGVSKVLWFQKEAPDLWDRVHTLGPPQTIFLRWLGCDESIVDFSSGSYLFPNDIRKKSWSEDIAAKLSFPLQKLPRLVESTEIVGELSGYAAEEMGLPSGVPIIAGGGDGQCAAAGTGIVVPGNVMVNLGTATGVQVYLSEPSFDPGQTLNCAAHVVTGAWEMEGHTQASGAVFRWFRDEFGGVERLMDLQSFHDAYDLLVDEATQSPAGAEDLIFLPTFNGSTAPIVDPFARGAFIGLKLSHQRSHIIRAVLEGISLEIRWMLDAIANTDVPVEEIRMAGGGSKNAIWNQIHADIFNRPIRTIQNPDAALVGGAMCAAVALEMYPDFQAAAEAFVQLGPLVEPINSNAEVYEESYARYVRLFKLLSSEKAFIT
ncbi:MAG: FGGY family carbohydrate kinase, partial [Anaerolineales bacterium]